MTDKRNINDQQVQLDEASPAKFRNLTGARYLVCKILFGILPVMALFFALQLPSYLGVRMFPVQGTAAFLAIMLFAIFLSVPVRQGKDMQTIPWYDLMLALLSLITGLNLTFSFFRISLQMGQPETITLVFGAILVLLLLEATRRLFGMTLVWIGVIFLLYARYSNFFGGFLQSRGYSWERIIEMLYYQPDGIMGMPLNVVMTVVVVFLLFGQALSLVGASDAMAELSMALMGKYRGGPAKIAIFASALLGSVSGSAAGNVATTGVLTIPLMKRVGYNAEFAGAVEAVASTGGQILPPVMGAAAFLMAEYLAIPYYQVIVAALLPAILYYFTAFIQVDLVAGKSGLKGLEEKGLPQLKESFKKSYLLFLSLVVLIVLLVGFDLGPANAGLYTVIFIGVMSLFIKGKRFTPAVIIRLLTDTGEALLEVSIVSALAGIVIGTVALTGVGISLSQMLVSLAHDSMFLMLVFTALAGIILGMGMTATAVYILLVILLGPGLIQAGIEPIAAHLFIFYFGMMSFITPPICIAAYVAAGIAKANPLRTGFKAIVLGLSGYIVPFIFVFEPQLLFIGTLPEVISTFLFVALGLASVSIAFVGYLRNRLSIWERAVFGVIGVLMILPGLESRIIGVVFLAIYWSVVAIRNKIKANNEYVGEMANPSSKAKNLS